MFIDEFQNANVIIGSDGQPPYKFKQKNSQAVKARERTKEEQNQHNTIKSISA